MNKNECEAYGKKYPSESALCKDLKINYNLFRNRKYRGWTLQEQLQGHKGKSKFTIEVQPITINRNFFNNRIINNINELERAISSFPDIKKINLIDYENVCDNKLLMDNHINDSNIINIFFFNACIYSNNYYNLIRDTNNINFQIVSTESADQLIDHMLIFYLGAINAKFPDKEVKIFSRDTGFHPFINNLKYDNISIATLENKSTKKGYRYSLAEYILNHEEINESAYFHVSDFKGLFSGYFNNKKKLTKKGIESLIKELIKFKFIKPADVLQVKQYRFCIKDIKKYKKEMDKN